MARPIAMTDAADPRLDDFRDLMAADRAPERREVVIGEGINVVNRVATSSYEIRAIVGVPAKLASLEHVGDSVPIYEVDKWVLSDVVGFRVTRGVLASVVRPPPVSATSLLADGRRFAVLETLNDFENLGSIFRNAAAFGLDGIFLDERCADPLYRRSVRVSMGHVFAVPFAVLPDPFGAALTELASAGIELLGLTPRNGAVDLRTVVPAPRWAVVLGAEGPGLTDATLAACDRLVRIPMASGVDSLNVATAGAVAFAHLVG